MNKSILLATVALASLAASSAFAGTASTCCADQAKVAATKPVPVKVVAPTELPRRYENTVVELAITLDEKGVPQEVVAANWMPSDLAARVLPAVQQWRFSPSVVNGQPVSGKFILPLQLAPEGRSTAATRVQHTADSREVRNQTGA